MNYRDTIKKGIETVNKNYQLIFIQTGILIIAFFLFLLIVGTPVIIIFTKAGIELPEEGLKGFLKIILKEGIQSYLSLVIILILSLLIYILFTSLIFIYAVAGTSGVLMSYIRGNEGYSWSLFHGYGKRFFKKFLLLLIIGLFTLILLSFTAGLISGLTKAPIIPYSDFIKEFFSNFLNLLSILLSFGMVIFFMATFTYAAGILLLKESTGVFGALKESLNFIIKRADSFVFYTLLSLGAIIIIIFFGMLGTIFKGYGGFVLYQLLLSILQIYINLSVISCAFVYLKDSL